MEELGLEEVAGRSVESVHVRLERLAVIHEAHERMDVRARDREHEARQVAEDHALLLREFSAEKCTEERLVELNHAIQHPLAVDGGVIGEAVEVRVEEVERGRKLD